MLETTTKMTLGERIVLVARLAATAELEFAKNDEEARRPREQRGEQRRQQRTTIAIGGAGLDRITDDPAPFDPSTGAREAETEIRSRAPRASQPGSREGAN